MSTALAEVANETSPAKPSALPDTWVERLFQRMEDRYGDLWANRYGAFPRERVKRTWAEDLADLTRGELARGVEACRSVTFAPTLAEFRKLCRPPIDFEAAYREAADEMAQREAGRDSWSHPAIFYAAAKIGAFDLRNSTWGGIEKRWRKVLQAELDKGEWPAIPERALALEAPKVTQATREEAAKRLQAMGATVQTQGSKEWAHRLMERIARGDTSVPAVAERYAKEAIEVAA